MQAFTMLKSISRSTGLHIHTKIRIFNSNFFSILLYGSECWKISVSSGRKLEVFQTANISSRSSGQTSNQKLAAKKNKDVYKTIQKICWHWLGHVLHILQLNHVKMNYQFINSFSLFYKQSNCSQNKISFISCHKRRAITRT